MKLQLHFRKVSETCFTVLRTDGTAIRTFTISQSLDVKNNGTNILFTDKQGRQLQELPITNFRNITIDDLPPFSTPKECVTALSAIVNFKHGGGTPVTTLSSDSVTNESSVEGDNVTEALDWLKENAATGKDGITPHIGSNGNWYIGETDTGVKAEGTNGNDGATPYISGRNWWVNGVDTGVQAQGQNGEPGMQGVPGKDGVPGQNGQDGDTPFIGVNGNWWIGKIDTGVAAQGMPGNNGKSAYESALLGGLPNTTSEQDFYEMLANSGGNVVSESGRWNTFAGSNMIQGEYFVIGNMCFITIHVLALRLPQGDTSLVGLPKIPADGEWTLSVSTRYYRAYIYTLGTVIIGNEIFLKESTPATQAGFNYESVTITGFYKIAE